MPARAALEQPRRDVVREPRRGSVARQRPARPAPWRCCATWRPSPSLTSRAARSASASSTVCLAAASSWGRSSSSAVSPGSASRRSSSRPRPAPRRGGRHRPLRDRRGVRRPGPPAGRPPRPARRTGRDGDPGGRRVGGRADRRARPRRAARRSSSSTPSRPRPSTTSTGRRGASARCVSRPSAWPSSAKSESIAVVLVGHVTKDGSLAGPKTLEHLVDAVLALEGERFAPLRIVRASKNRFGSTEEVGVFEMGAAGLIELDDPARAFLADATRPARRQRRRPDARGQPADPRRGPGCSLRRARSGRRDGRRAAVDPNRVALLIAVLGRRAGIGLVSHDVYVNLAGGLRSKSRRWTCRSPSPSRSSLRDRPIRAGTVAIGEVGLLGELRPVPGLERRLREAARLDSRGRSCPRARPCADRAPRRRRTGDRPRRFPRDAVEAALDPVADGVASAPARC